MTNRVYKLVGVIVLGFGGLLSACANPRQETGSGGNESKELAAASAPAMKVHYIDVDQGNAALVEFSCAAILVDAGSEVKGQVSAKLMNYLDEFFARRTDLNRTLAGVYITHTHTDHNASLRAVVEQYKVLNYIHNGVYDGSGDDNAEWMRDHANDNGRKITMRAVSHADVAKITARNGLTDNVIDPVKCPGADPRISILFGPYAQNPGWPPKEFKNGNNQGIVIRIDYGASSFLFLGDLETDALETMVDYYSGTKTLDVDVFLVSHHGSYNGTTPSLLAALSPDIGVISVGPAVPRDGYTAWTHGHPRKVAVDMIVPTLKLSRSTPKVVKVATGQRKFVNETIFKALYATGWDGNVVIEADLKGRLAVNDNALMSFLSAIR